MEEKITAQEWRRAIQGAHLLWKKHGSFEKIPREELHNFQEKVNEVPDLFRLRSKTALNAWKGTYAARGDLELLKILFNRGCEDAALLIRNARVLSEAVGFGPNVKRSMTDNILGLHRAFLNSEATVKTPELERLDFELLRWLTNVNLDFFPVAEREKIEEEYILGMAESRAKEMEGLEKAFSRPWELEKEMNLNWESLRTVEIPLDITVDTSRLEYRIRSVLVLEEMAEEMAKGVADERPTGNSPVIRFLQQEIKMLEDEDSDEAKIKRLEKLLAKYGPDQKGGEINE